MALSELLTFPRVVSLAPGTGVQFLDFGFSLAKRAGLPEDWGFDGRGARKNFDAPLLRARRDDVGVTGTQETYTVDVKAIVSTFDRVWMPLPMLRRRAQRFDPGPVNWTRVYLAKLPEPDSDGRDYRLVIACDTTLLDRAGEAHAYLGPSPSDAQTGSRFEIVGWNDDAEWYFEQGWVREWCFEVMKESLERDDPSAARFYSGRGMSDDDMLESMSCANEHVARYRAFIDLLFSLDIVPALSLPERSAAQAPPIDVDLVLDLGNSRSCGLLIESDRDQVGGADVGMAVKLELRDLGMAEQVYSDPFPSRFEFARAEFGREHLSVRSGRAQAFGWPTVVRVGVEAARLAAQRSGTEGASGMSSPKRYLWDEDPRNDGWRFNVDQTDVGLSDLALGVAFTTFVNDLGEPLHRLDPETAEEDPGRGLQAILATYSRRNLTAFALSEIFVQAFCMMNSAGHRQRRPANRDLPRRLRRIILTMPTAMSPVERRLLEEQARNACDLAFLSLRLASLQYGSDGMARIEYSPSARPHPTLDAGPEVLLQWDEATATQAVYLYTQVGVNYSGDARSFFDSVRHPDNRGATSKEAPAFRLATLDIGGGTTDLVITEIDVEGDGANVTLLPKQVFREGFNLAGDDALLAVVREHVIGPIRQALRQLGKRADQVLDNLIGADNSGMKAIDLMRRQQFAAQIAAPIALGMLQEYEQYDPLRPAASTRRTFDQFFQVDTRPSRELVAHFEAEFARTLAPGFSFAALEFEIDPVRIDLTVRNVFADTLAALTEMVHAHRCDLLIVSGRTSRLPGVLGLIEECSPLPGHRIVPMHLFRVGSWYPFRDHLGTVGDPKTTAAVGAMICLLGNGQLQNFNFRSNNLKPGSTARYFGKLDLSGRLLKIDEFASDLHEDDPQPMVFEFRGPMPLGFRQLPVEWWPATRLYQIDYRTPADAKLLSEKTPLRVELRRPPGRGQSAAPLAIRSVRATRGGSASDEEGNSRLRLRLQTVGNPRGYWLDTGVLLGS